MISAKLIGFVAALTNLVRITAPIGINYVQSTKHVSSRFDDYEYAISI